jgi:hypothetical protein
MWTKSTLVQTALSLDPLSETRRWADVITSHRLNGGSNTSLDRLK